MTSSKMNCNWKYILILVICGIISIVVAAVCLINSGGSSSSDGNAETVTHTNSGVVELNIKKSEQSARTYIDQLNLKLIGQCSHHSTELGKYMLNVNQMDNYLHSLADYETFLIAIQKEIQKQQFVLDDSWKQFTNESLKSSIRAALELPVSTLSKEKRMTHAKLHEQFQQRIFATSSPYLKQLSEFDDEVQDQGGPSPANYGPRLDINRKTWVSFHNEFGRWVQARIFPDYVNILQEELKISSRNQHIGSSIEEVDFNSFNSIYYHFYGQLNSILERLTPLYTSLHAYVRGTSLDFQRDAFNDHTLIEPNGPIPIHFISGTGNWYHYKDEVNPYDDQIHMGLISFNIMNNGLSSKELLSLANELFVSLNLTRHLPDSFSKNAVFIKETPNESTCGRLIDICSSIDNNYKPIFCEDTSYENFVDFNSKLGNIQFMLTAASHPGLALPSRGINPILLHANGVLWKLLASSPKYLDSAGLWDHVDWNRSESEPTDNSSIINFQYNQALAIIPTMLEFISLFKWQHALLEHKFNYNNSNCAYWHIRQAFEGIQPPEIRRIFQFDAFRAFGFQSSLEEFIGQMIGFQLHRELCTLAGEYNPNDPDTHGKFLQQCDIRKSGQAREMLLKFMNADTSRPIQDILQDVLGSNEISVDAMLDYFEPLYSYLSSLASNRSYSTGWENRSINYQSCV